MALAHNEYTSITIEEESGIPGVTRILFVLHGDPVERAMSIAASGKPCELVTTRVSWRGKNGKQKREELSRRKFEIVK